MPRPFLKQDQVIARFIAKHGTKYDYSKVVYVHSHSKVLIICPKHGEFWQSPASHMICSCQQCGQVDQQRNSPDILLSRAILAHGNKYDYSLVQFESPQEKVTIKCPIHGEFRQRWSIHTNGYGCQACGNVLRINNDTFKKRARSVHGDRYNYDKVAYVNLNTHVIISCRTHGDFRQIPCNHLAGNNCPKCNSKFVKQDLWLDSLGLPNDPLHRQVHLKLTTGRHIFADGYNPISNTVYEFWGDRWHGNPAVYDPEAMFHRLKTTYGDLYTRTLKKIQDIKLSGYNLIDIWECDWDSKVSLR